MEDQAQRQADRLREQLQGHQAVRLPLNALPPAAVLVPLLWKHNCWQLLFEIRSEKIIQGGEICLPGGGLEPGETPREAAIRETAEELLLDRRRIEVICPLHTVAGPGGREVSSWLGILSGYEGTWEKEEVSRTFLLPLSWFAANSPVQYTAELVTEVPDNFPLAAISRGGEKPFHAIPKDFWFYSTPYGVMWGLTAQIIRGALPLITGSLSDRPQ